MCTSLPSPTNTDIDHICQSLKVNITYALCVLVWDGVVGNFTGSIAYKKCRNINEFYLTLVLLTHLFNRPWSEVRLKSLQLVCAVVCVSQVYCTCNACPCFLLCVLAAGYCWHQHRCSKVCSAQLSHSAETQLVTAAL